MAHSHAPALTSDTSPDRSKRVLSAAIINLSFTIIELIGGLLTNSVAVLSDALHDLGDSIALFSSYFAERQAQRGPDAKRTFGYARISVFSAFINATILMVGSIFILNEAIHRLFAPEPVHAIGVIWLAVFGIVVNYIAYARLNKGVSINEQVLSWHLLEDVIGWVAVLIGSIIMYFTDFCLIDPILTIGFTLFILWGVWGGMRDVLNILMEGTPADIDITAVIEAISTISNIESVHDVHVWSLDGENHILTCHVVVPNYDAIITENLKDKIEHNLESFNIKHTTIEFETPGQCEDLICAVAR